MASIITELTALVSNKKWQIRKAATSNVILMKKLSSYSLSLAPLRAIIYIHRRQYTDDYDI